MKTNLKEEVKKILRQNVTILEFVATDRIGRWDSHYGKLCESDVDRIADQICQRLEQKEGDLDV